MTDNKIKCAKKSTLFDCLTDKQKTKGKKKGIRMVKREDKMVKRCKKIKHKSCPGCGSNQIFFIHICSRRLHSWWRLECWECHWCGKTKLFLRRAIKSWNKEVK